MSPVLIMDTVTMGPEQAAAWVRHLPEVTERAAAHGGQVTVWQRHAPDGRSVVELVVLWQLPDTAAYWALRGAVSADPGVAAWWRRTDRAAVARDRRVLVACGVR